MDDKCPWCGAAIADEGLTRNVWECETWQGLYLERTVIRGNGCYERQLSRMQPVVDAVAAMLAIDKEHRFQALAEVIEAGEKYKEAEQ